MLGNPGRTRTKFLTDASRYQPKFGEMLTTANNFHHPVRRGKFLGNPVMKINRLSQTGEIQEPILKIPEFKWIGEIPENIGPASGSFANEKWSNKEDTYDLKPPPRNFETFKNNRNIERNSKMNVKTQSLKSLNYPSEPLILSRDPYIPTKSLIDHKDQKENPQGFKDFKPSPQIPFPEDEEESSKFLLNDGPKSHDTFLIQVEDQREDNFNIAEDLAGSSSKDNVIIFSPTTKIPKRKSRKRGNLRKVKNQWTPMTQLENSNLIKIQEENFQYRSILENARRAKPSIYLDDGNESAYYVSDGELIPVPMMTKLPNYFLR